MALTIGLEPTTNRLTADCSAIELSERINDTVSPCMEYINDYKIFLQDIFFIFSIFFLRLFLNEKDAFMWRL